MRSTIILAVLLLIYSTSNFAADIDRPAYLLLVNKESSNILDSLDVTCQPAYSKDYKVSKDKIECKFTKIILYKRPRYNSLSEWEESEEWKTKIQHYSSPKDRKKLLLEKCTSQDKNYLSSNTKESRSRKKKFIEKLKSLCKNPHDDALKEYTFELQRLNSKSCYIHTSSWTEVFTYQYQSNVWMTDTAPGPTECAVVKLNTLKIPDPSLTNFTDFNWVYERKSVVTNTDSGTVCEFLSNNETSERYIPRFPPKTRVADCELLIH
jgi:hypothetical protein